MICEGCPFGGPLVGMGGDPQSDVIFIGEGPGPQELAAGRPFVGPTGQLLWETLHKVGLPAEYPVATDNACRCRTPGNLAQHPQVQQAISACRPHLFDDIRGAHRKLIVALGNTANWSLGNNGRITQIRGRIYYREISAMDGPVPVLPVIHPSAILRQTQDFGQFASDLRYAVKILLGQEEIRDPGITEYIVATEDNYDRILSGMESRGGIISVDIENSGVSFSPRKERLLCIGFSWEKNRAAVFPEELIAKILPRLRTFFQCPSIKFAWHGGKYDHGFGLVRDVIMRIDEDSMLAHYALNEIKGTHDLEQVAGDIIGAKDYKDEVKVWIPNKRVGFERLPQKVLFKRSAQDVDYTRQVTIDLLQRLDNEANKGPRWAYRNIMIPAASFLARVEARGLYVDKINLEALRIKLTERVAIQKKSIQELLTKEGLPGHIYNPGSWEQMSWVMYRHFKLTPPRGFLKDTRKETVAAILERCELSPVTEEFLRLQTTYRKTAKALGTYVEGMEKQIDLDGRIHTTFNIHGTVTGRLSSSRPNLQNIPRDATVKRIFSSAPGHMFLETDYNQAEPRVLTHLSHDKQLYYVYAVQKRSLHKEFSLARYGEDYSGDQYIRAKATTLGIMYGRGGASIAQEYNFPIAEGEELVRVWFRNYPEAAEFIRKCRMAVYKGGVLQSPFGRRRRFTLVTDQNVHELQNEAANFPMSSTASDLTLISAMSMEDGLAELDAYTLVLVHDSNLIELPLDVDKLIEATKISVRIAEQLPRTLLKTEVPFPVEVKIGTHWGELKELPHPQDHPEEFERAARALVDEIRSREAQRGLDANNLFASGSGSQGMAYMGGDTEDTSDNERDNDS